jgi:putative spermidine/putrescine transport system permease protein
MRAGLLLWRIWITAIFLFLPAPIVIVAISSFSRTGYLQFPPQQFSVRWYQEFLSSEAWLKPLAISFALALVVAIVTTVFSFLAAFAVTRIRFRGKPAFDTLMLSPLLFPHAAIGVTLLGLLAAVGWVGHYSGILLAHIILCIPFAYRPALNSMRKLDLSVEEAAMSLGARPGYVFRTVTLPLLRSGLVTALLFSFIISFDEVTVSIFLVGPEATTLPTKIFAHIQESASPVVAAISTFLVAITIGLIVLLQRLIGLDLFIKVERPR